MSEQWCFGFLWLWSEIVHVWTIVNIIGTSHLLTRSQRNKIKNDRQHLVTFSCSVNPAYESKCCTVVYLFSCNAAGRSWAEEVHSVVLLLSIKNPRLFWHKAPELKIIYRLFKFVSTPNKISLHYITPLFSTSHRYVDVALARRR